MRLAASIRKTWQACVPRPSEPKATSIIVVFVPAISAVGSPDGA